MLGGKTAVSVGLLCRIVTTDLQGKFIHQVGGNGPTLRDGSFEEAGFSRPQGLAFASTSNSLYVADTENHALRKVTLHMTSPSPAFTNIPLFLYNLAKAYAIRSRLIST